MAALSEDAQWTILNHKLQRLRRQRRNTRPEVFISLAIIGITLGYLLLPHMPAYAIMIFGFALLITGLNTIGRVDRLDIAIADTEVQIHRATAQARRPVNGLVAKLEDLRVLRDKSLITLDEFDAKKAELLKQV